MKINYQNKRIEKICIDARVAEKRYGGTVSEKIQQRIDELKAAETIEMMIKYHIGRCHPLSQNRKGQFALDLVHPYRLVFERYKDEIHVVNILEIVDYH